MYKSDVLAQLEELNQRLAKDNLVLDLQVVGGAALLFNGLTFIESDDIDSMLPISGEVRRQVDAVGIDINDDANDYLDDYKDYSFLEFEERYFSNIHITYLELAGVLATKMQYLDIDDKVIALYDMMSEDFGIEMTVNGICSYMEDELGLTISAEIVQNFLDAYDEYYYYC